MSVGSEKQLDMKVELLSEFLQGEIGGTADAESSASIARVIVAGNSVAKPTIVVDSKAPVRYHKRGREKYTYN